MGAETDNGAQRGCMAKLRELKDQAGAIGYIALWALGVPASLLFVIFLMRGCT